MSVDGTDVVYKDIIEPLESASVTISKTDKSSVTEFGNPLEVTTVFLAPTRQYALHNCKGVNNAHLFVVFFFVSFGSIVLSQQDVVYSAAQALCSVQVAFSP